MATTSRKDLDAELAAWLQMVRGEQNRRDNPSELDRLADLWIANGDAKAIKDPRSPAYIEAHMKINAILDQIVGL
jgi:hypothetical protein